MSDLIGTALFKYSMDTFLIDAICLLPLFQQIAGGGGMLIAGALLISEVAQGIFNEFKFKREPQNYSIEEQKKFRERTNEAIFDKQADILRNLLRFIPVVGSAFSLLRLATFITHVVGETYKINSQILLLQGVSILKNS